MNLRNLMIAACALALGGCAMEDDDVTTGSRLYQPPAGTAKVQPVEAGDIAIVGQDVAQKIIALPQIAGDTVPPLVRFNGVTSIVDKPIDTEPYTELLRDRLLLLTRAKLRFVEHTLPPYVPGGKHKHEEQPVQNTTDADYEVLAELRGHADADTLRIQVEFVDAHSRQVLFNEVYRIKPEAGSSPDPQTYTAPMAPPPSAPADTTTAQQTPPPAQRKHTQDEYVPDVPSTEQPTKGTPPVFNNNVL